MKKSEAEIERIVAEFVNLLAQGKAVSWNEFLNRYPKLASKLGAQLKPALILTEAVQKKPTMPEALKQKLHNQFWQKVLAKERQHLLAVKQVLLKRQNLRKLPIKQGIEFLLLVLHSEEKEPLAIRGITRIMKLLFLLAKETGCDKYCSDYYQFIPYKLGPFAPKVYEDLRLLIELGFVTRKSLPLIYAEEAKIDEGFRFNEITTVYSLTELGKRYAAKLACGLKPRLLNGIRAVRTQFAQLPLKELLAYVYHRYPEYTTQSELLKQLLKQT